MQDLPIACHTHIQNIYVLNTPNTHLHICMIIHARMHVFMQVLTNIHREQQRTCSQVHTHACSDAALAELHQGGHARSCANRHTSMQICLCVFVLAQRRPWLGSTEEVTHKLQSLLLPDSAAETAHGADHEGGSAFARTENTAK